MDAAPQPTRLAPPLELVPPPHAAPEASRAGWARALLDPREPFLAPLLLLLVTRGYFWLLLPFAGEDAYITYRFSRNLVLGYGLTYNPGERVMGFSSPLWTMWNAVGYALTRDPVAWSRVSSVAADVVSLALLGGLIQRYASRRSAWCFTLFFALWTSFAAVAVSGMESSAMLALIALSAVALERRSRFTGVALAALAAIRPEGLAAAALLGLGARARDRAVAGTLVAAMMAALWGYFGSIVPQSVLAKSSIYGTPGPVAGRHWWEWICPFAFGRWPVTTEGSILFAIAVVSAPAAIAGASRLARTRATPLALALGAATVVWLGYSALGVAYFAWYLTVPLAGLMGLAAVGLPHVAKGRAIPISLLVFVLGTWTVAPELYRARGRAEWLSFGAAAEYLAAHSRVGQTVLLEPIGMVGWRCKLRIIDEVGLVSPQVSRRRLQGPGWMADVIRAERPDWLVIRRGVLRDNAAFAGIGEPFRSTAERDSVAAHYVLATVVHEDTGDQALAVMSRRP